ncbi:MAG TPA: hypothetical protein VFX76_10475 [Roseiflexaceae bacterium]|nr:hypothetical protein [Roseiflexaceae bacterium]
MPSEDPTPATLVAIRAAHHPETNPKYDRVVFEFDGPIPLLHLQYVDQLIADGSGAPIFLAGQAIMRVQFMPANAHDDRYNSTAPQRMKPGMPLVKEIVSAGDFEAVVTYGIGLARKAETRMLTLAEKSRVVIDFFL